MEESVELVFEIEPERQQELNTALEKLQRVSEPFLINVLASSSEPQGSVLLYQTKFDVMGVSLDDRKKASQPLTARELGDIAYAYTRAMATAQELVSSMQELQVAAIDSAAIYVTEKEEVKVNLLQAVIVPGSQDVVSVLFRAAFFRDMETAEEAGMLLERVAPDRRELTKELIDGNRDYATLARRAANLPIYECQFCHYLKAPLRVPLCPQHFFCSELCFKKLKESTNTTDHRCPLCPVKPKSRMVLKPKEESKTSSSQVCIRCKKDFRNTGEDSWRMELLGTTGYTSCSAYCSQQCYESQFPQAPAKLCVACRRSAPETETSVVLHCEQHSLCSKHCRDTYYRGQDLTLHSLNGALICYECLEAYLREVGPAEDSPEVREMAKKVRAFHTQPSLVQKPPTAHSETHLSVVDCEKYISPSALRYAFYRTMCLFCEKSIRVQKAINEDFVLNDTSPLLVACDFRLHGVCSRKCVRNSVPRCESSHPLTIRCPLCPFSLITSESLSLVLDSRNPTQEFVRRTPLSTCGSVKCQKHYVLPGCRHEICTNAMNSCVDSEGAVVCRICGFRCSLEKATETAFEIVVKQEAKGRD